MNSEELEISLRTEFESYLNGVLAEMRQEVSDFQERFQTEQEKFQAEFEKHKSQLDGVFRDFSSRIENDKQLDEAFKESVVEHLRLAKDEGARITAAAIAEAEDREKENSAALAAASVSYSELRDAINDISSQDSQAGILKSLVNNAAHFTPRGAFFIIKNEHFVGWRVFGKEGTMDEQSVREVYFPMSNETVLSEAVRSLSPVESNYGTFSDDSVYLDKLEFGQPDRMYAIPLIARGRGVAVLYADYGVEGVAVNIEALETLVRVAGLTVELLAAAPGTRIQATTRQTISSQANSNQTESSQTNSNQTSSTEYYAAETQSQTYNQPAETETGQTYPVSNDYQTAETASENYDSPAAETGYSSDYSSENESYGQAETSGANEFQSETPSESYQNYYQEYGATSETPEYRNEPEPEQQYSWNNAGNYSDDNDETYVVEDVIVEDETFTSGFADNTNEPSQDYTTISSYDFETPSSDSSATTSERFEQLFKENDAQQFQPTNSYSDQSFETARNETVETYTPAPVETVSNTSAAPVKTRLSERNVDLPIEVPEDERRFHNDARRFARLLVSEIKLYNEQKVKEGRESRDLYERLREAIDRSREMYDKRVQPPVAAKFDYFNYEIINSLAEGDESKLGANYPGTNV